VHPKIVIFSTEENIFRRDVRKEIMTAVGMTEDGSSFIKVAIKL